MVISIALADSELQVTGGGGMKAEKSGGGDASQGSPSTQSKFRKKDLVFGGSAIHSLSAITSINYFNHD